MSELIGKIVCGYRITAQIGAGGMGIVYLAESAFLKEYKQQVAIKTLTAQAGNEQQAALMHDLFEREANIHVQVKHLHIVNVIQFAIEDHDAYLLLEYVPGYEHQGHHIGSITEMIRYETGPVPHQRALRLFVQALDAISYAHNFRYHWAGNDRVGLVHRDIKPANLLLADPQTLKVTDFGIVKVRHIEGVASGTSKLNPGTSAYMSPEAILGPDQFGLTELDARSDIYALGVTLFEMLAGRRPFMPDPDKNPDISLRSKHVQEAPPLPSSFYPGVPPELDRIVLRALEKNPDHRYQTAAEFKQAIIGFAGDLNVVPDRREVGRAVSPVIASPEPDDSFATTSIPVINVNTAPPADETSRLAGIATSPEPVILPTVAAPAEIIAPPTKNSRTLIGAMIVMLLLAATAMIFYFYNQRSHASLKPPPVFIPSPGPVTPAIPPGMKLIPAGSFQMGRNLTAEEKQFRLRDSAGTTTEVFSFDEPAHDMKVADFYLDVTEVSNREYAKFVSATHHQAPAGWNRSKPPEGAEDIPVTNVTYNDAVEFCNWRASNRKDGLAYRLPTEEEWEYAARGSKAGTANGRMNLYPWGDEWKPGLSNTRESRLNHSQIVTANRTGASPFGILNLSGNVAEWTATDFNHYPGSDRRTPREPGYQGTYQVIRGGSFDYAKEWAMTTTRAWARPTVTAPNIGFRGAAELKR